VLHRVSNKGNIKLDENEEGNIYISRLLEEPSFNNLDKVCATGCRTPK
jgi:hypothetical protein